jgi:hypothetical protein
MLPKRILACLILAGSLSGCYVYGGPSGYGDGYYSRPYYGYAGGYYGRPGSGGTYNTLPYLPYYSDEGD